MKKARLILAFILLSAACAGVYAFKARVPQSIVYTCGATGQVPSSCTIVSITFVTPSAPNFMIGTYNCTATCTAIFTTASGD